MLPKRATKRQVRSIRGAAFSGEDLREADQALTLVNHGAFAFLPPNDEGFRIG
jgi:hypothetical protein